MLSRIIIIFSLDFFFKKRCLSVLLTRGSTRIVFFVSCNLKYFSAFLICMVKVLAREGPPLLHTSLIWIERGICWTYSDIKIIMLLVLFQRINWCRNESLLFLFFYAWCFKLPLIQKSYWCSLEQIILRIPHWSPCSCQNKGILVDIYIWNHLTIP